MIVAQSGGSISFGLTGPGDLANERGDLLDRLDRLGERRIAERYSNFARRVWKPALIEAELPDMGVHALRHTCAALLISQGAHPKAIQSHLGHRSITTTLDGYGHLFEDEHEKLADRIDAAYAELVVQAGTEHRAPSITRIDEAS